MDEGREYFEKWAGDHKWSDWTKPTLFASHFMSPIAQAAELADLLASARAITALGTASTVTVTNADGSKNCVVVDHPGASAIALGVSLAEKGFAPVVLFNGVASLADPLIRYEDVYRALVGLAPNLKFSEDPAPAFLLDSRRKDGVPAPRRYDNRWITFPQDFPSAGRLQAEGITRCYLIAEPKRVADDLAHVLRRWQDAGIEIYEASTASPSRLDIRRPLWFKQIFYRWVALMGFHANSFGGFGATIPEPSQGGYG